MKAYRTVMDFQLRDHVSPQLERLARKARHLLIIRRVLACVGLAYLATLTWLAIGILIGVLS